MALRVPNLLDQLIEAPIRRMSIALERRWRMVSLAIPTSHILSVFIGVAGCGWPMSWRVVRSMARTFPLRKVKPSSASAAEDMTVRIMLLGVWIAPLCGGLGAFVRSTGHCFLPLDLVRLADAGISCLKRFRQVTHLLLALSIL